MCLMHALYSNRMLPWNKFHCSTTQTTLPIVSSNNTACIHKALDKFATFYVLQINSKTCNFLPFLRFLNQLSPHWQSFVVGWGMCFKCCLFDREQLVWVLTLRSVDVVSVVVHLSLCCAVDFNDQGNWFLIWGLAHVLEWTLSCRNLSESSVGRWWGREGSFTESEKWGGGKKKLLPLTERILILSFSICRIHVVIINSHFIML